MMLVSTYEKKQLYKYDPSKQKCMSASKACQTKRKRILSDADGSNTTIDVTNAETKMTIVDSKDRTVVVSIIASGSVFISDAMTAIGLLCTI